ncbi:MAG: hypothetical protein WAR01_12940 [Dokdonella sp.]|uniref:hypothetical protein n=2 Tax=Dokdonella sp. TaxID=2291710 RepID=UPI002BDC7CA6|nr:hypothetical protein [Dokdonella sp.]
MTIRTRSHHLVVMIACGSLRGAPAIAEDIVRVQRPDVVLPWFNGVIGKVGTDIAWLSDPPITEIRVQGHAGSTLLPPNRRRRLGHGCRALSGTACAVAGERSTNRQQLDPLPRQSGYRRGRSPVGCLVGQQRCPLSHAIRRQPTDPRYLRDFTPGQRLSSRP